MESWQNGRRHLFEELAKVCDRIETNLAKELAHDNSIPIIQDKLLSPRDQSPRVHELTDEVSTLPRQKRAQETIVADAGLVHESNAEIRLLVEDNARLAAELETHKDANASLRVGGLAKENKRLAEELKHDLQQAQTTEKSAADKRVCVKDLKWTRDPPGSPPSARQVEYDESQMVTKEIYQSLVKKFNQVYEKWSDAKATRDKLSQVLGDERAKVKRYEQYCKIEEREKARRDEKIQRQDEEIERLRTKILEVEGRSKMQNPPTERLGEQRGAQNLEGVARALNSASLGPVQYAGKVINFEDLVQALKSPTLNSNLAASRRIHVLQISPLQQSRLEFIDHPAVSPLSRLSEAATASSRSNQNEDKTTFLWEVPMLMLGGHPPGNANVDDTEFEILESHHTNSTDEVDLTSPQHPLDEQIKEELLMDACLSPETPVVISSRSVKKIKGSHDTTTPINISNIKVETISSSPLGLAAFQTFNESIDLDEIGEKQATPRKGRPFLQHALRTSSYKKIAAQETQSQDHSYPNNIAKSEQVLQVTPIRRAETNRARPTLQPLTTNKQIMPRTSEDRSSKRRRVASDKAVEELVEDGEHALSVKKSSRKKTTPEMANRLDNLLAKASPPNCILSPASLTNLVQTKPRQSRGSTVLSQTYDVLQQDPSKHNRLLFPCPQTSPMMVIPRPTLWKPMEASQLSSKGSSPGLAEPSRPSSKGTIKDSAYGSRPPSRESPAGLTEPSRISKGVLTASAEPLRPSRNSIRRSLEPPRPSSSRSTPLARKRALRSRPLLELTLHDFKINPNYNQGYDYAFSDVVRNKADRQCLQGCTKLECCGGAFRAFAEALRDPNKPPTMSQEEADERLLDGFLGGNRYKVQNMTKAERDETLLQARTREMANKHGRHRHAYERSRTPPGFWRSDFPTTQEDMQDRAKGEQQERDDIAQRYQEAMRQGRYIFRDE